MFTALLSASLLAPAAPVPKEIQKKPDDRARIVGTWAITRANENGKDTPNFIWHSMTFTADGQNVFGYRTSPDEGNEYRLDLDAAPRTLTFLRDSVAVNKPRPYEFRENRLVVAMKAGDREPAKSLEPGPGVIVLEYERVEPKADK